MAMPAQKSRARIARSTTQVGLPSLVIGVLAAFDVIDWTTEQTTAVVALATFVIAVIMNVTSWGRKVFAPDG